MQFVSFSQDIGSWKKGDIVELEDKVARSFVDNELATNSSAGDALKASLRAENDRFQRTLIDELKTAISGRTTATQGPPTGGGLVQFDKISAGESSVERDVTGRPHKGSFGDLCKCIFHAQAVGVPDQVRSHAVRRLAGIYCDGFADYSIDEATGNIVETRTRSLDGGGIEKVIRTGTESVSGGATYGFAVKPEWYGSLFEIPIEQQAFINGAFQVPVGNALEFKWPALDQYKAPTSAGGITQSAIYAGFQLYYKGEITQRTYSDGALDMIGFKIVDLTGFTTLSRDLIADNYIAMDAMAQRVFARAFQWMEDYMSIQGPGGGKPEGYFNANAALTQTRGTASHIYYADLVGMLKQLHPSCWTNARWITNVTTVTELTAIQASAGVYVYQPNALISQAMAPAVIDKTTVDKAGLVHRPQGTLLGFPLYFTEKVPTLGTQGDLSLVDPSQYGYAKRQGLEIGLSEHFLFDTDQIAYRFKLRHDGKSLWRAPYQQADGSSTKVSPFVILK